MVKVYNHIEKIAKWILVLSLGIMAVLNFGNVISRYIFHASFSFTEEITTNLFVLNTFLAAAVAARSGGHLGLTIISDRLSEKNQKTLSFIVSIVSAVLFGILVYNGIEMIKSQIMYGQKSAALGIPEWLYGISIPLGATLCALGFLIGGIEGYKRKED